MELKQLKYFIEVAKREHISEAALELNIAQSAVSRQITQLEKELGVALFKREGRHIHLTHEGQQLLNEAYEIIEKVESTVQQLKYHSESRTHTLRIGYVKSYTSHILTMLIQTFEQQHDVNIIPMCLDQNTIANALQSHDIDMAFDTYDEQRYNLKHINACPIFDETYHIYVHADDPVTLTTQPTLQQLKHQEWFHYGDTPDDILQTVQHRIQKPIYMLDHAQLVKHVLKTQKGIVIMPQYVFIDDNPTVWQRIALNHTDLKRTIYCLTKTGNPKPQLQSLQDIVQQLLHRSTSYF